MRRRTYILAGLVLFGLFPPILSPTATYVQDSADSLVFAIYPGEKCPPLCIQAVSEAVSETLHAQSSLKPNTTYQLKIIAKDNHNSETEGPAWNFTTNNTPPSTVNNRFADDGAVVAYENIYLDWDYAAIPNEGESW